MEPVAGAIERRGASIASNPDAVGIIDCRAVPNPRLAQMDHGAEGPRRGSSAKKNGRHGAAPVRPLPCLIM